MGNLVARLLAFVFIVGSTGAALADPAGLAEGVDPAAEARAAQTRTLVVGSDIFIGDRIVTGGAGQVQILFSDNTKLVVGPRSALLIEDYLLRENGSAGKLVLDALGGTYRFVTGRSPKDRYEINTPGGTISVRGTALEIWAGNGIAYALVQQGIACAGNECSDNICEVLKIDGSNSEVMGHADDFTGEERDQIKEWFKYAVDQSGVMGKYRLPNGLDCLRLDPPSGGAASVVGQDTGDGGSVGGNDECDSDYDCNVD
jgi:hypothetical protein